MTDPLIARLDALAEKANRESWELSVPCQEDADFIAALVTAWPEIRARLAAGDKLRGLLRRASALTSHHHNAKYYMPGSAMFDGTVCRVCRDQDADAFNVDVERALDQ